MAKLRLFYGRKVAAAGAVTAALTGTAASSLSEEEVVAGGKTIILTLTNDTWVASGGTFDAQRQNIINGIDSAQSEATGWDVEVKAKQAVTGVVRTSDTVVTITLGAQAAYNITSQETITATIPASAVTGGVAIVASPTFTVSAAGSADVTIEPGISTSHARAQRNMVFTTKDIGYLVYIDADNDIKYIKTTDGGATWSGVVALSSPDTDLSIDMWYDQDTPGDTGTLLHVWWISTVDDNVYYRTIDTGSSDALGTLRTVFDGATAVNGRSVFASGTKTRSGYLYCAYNIDEGDEKGFQRSTDGGATWSSVLSATFVEATLDQCLLFPASNTGDDNDCWALYHDASADELTLKMWDSSAGSEVESAVIAAVVENTTDQTGQYGFSGSVRHSDGHVIAAAVTERDTATSDHRVFDINGTGSITELAPITTNIDDHYYPQVFINQANDDIYVAYNGKRDGSQTMDTTTKVYYTKSTDGGTSWTVGDTRYMEGAAAAVLQIGTPLMGDRFYVSWRVGTALYGNASNSLDLTPAVGGGLLPQIMSAGLYVGAYQ